MWINLYSRADQYCWQCNCEIVSTNYYYINLKFLFFFYSFLFIGLKWSSYDLEVYILCPSMEWSFITKMRIQKKRYKLRLWKLEICHHLRLIQMGREHSWVWRGLATSGNRAMLVVSKFMIIPHITLENHSKFSHGACFVFYISCGSAVFRFFLFPLMVNVLS